MIEKGAAEDSMQLSWVRRSIERAQHDESIGRAHDKRAGSRGLNST